MLKNALDILLGLAILASGIVGGVLAEAKIGVYNRLNGTQAAQATCADSALPVAGPDTPWGELPQVAIPGDVSPAFVYVTQDAPLRVQVFLDADCPFSQQWVKTVLPELLKRNDVRLEFHDFPLPFHPNAEQAAQAGRCAAEQGRYIEFLTALAGYETPDGKAVTLAADAAGLDVEKMLQCLPTQESNVKLDFMAAQDAGVSGTPTTIINGRAIVGALPWKTFERLLEEALR